MCYSNFETGIPFYRWLTNDITVITTATTKRFMNMTDYVENQKKKRARKLLFLNII